MKFGSLGELIKYRREEKEWTQKELAERVGTIKCAISGYERNINKPKPKRLEDIKIKLGILDKEIEEVYPEYEEMHRKYKKYKNLQRANTLGNLLRKYRLEKGWTQEKLADKAGTSEGIIWLYENGYKPPFWKLERIRIALDIPVLKLEKICKGYKDFLIVNDQLGGLLKEYRLKRRLTQRELADRMGLSPIMISVYERGKYKPGFEVIEKIRKRENLGIPINRLKKVCWYDKMREEYKKATSGFGGFLKERRIKKGLTQRELAKKIGVCKGTIRKYEGYERNEFKLGFETLEKYRVCLRISIKELNKFFDYSKMSEEYKKATSGFGGFLKERREKMRLSWEELADKVGVSMQMIWRYECNRSKPLFNKLERLVEILDIPERELERVDKKYYEEYLKHKKSEEKHYSGLVEAIKEYLRR